MNAVMAGSAISQKRVSQFSSSLYGSFVRNAERNTVQSLCRWRCHAGRRIDLDFSAMAESAAAGGNCLVSQLANIVASIVTNGVADQSAL